MSNHPSAFHVIPAVDTATTSATPTHRPVRFAEIVGQARLIDRLTTHIESAVARKAQPGHVLLDGGPGLGKTTVGAAIAGELAARGMPTRFRSTSAQAIPSVRKLILELAQLKNGDVWLIDEIQELKPAVQVGLLTALEDGVVTVEGSAKAPSQQFALAAITIIGATTHPGRMQAPLRDRFKITCHLEPYLPDDLVLVTMGYAELSDIDLTWEAGEIISRAARYTPRRAIKLVDACRDRVIQTTGDLAAKIDADGARDGLAFAEIDQYGLEERDRRVLSTLATTYFGGPVGLNPLSAALGMHPSELRDDVEPFLIRAGLLQLLTTGRACTNATYGVLGLQCPPLPYGLGR